ncbi:MAG: nicotinate-nucleotide adenylyltransferase [Lachnospiraceae bacterium]|nr:nicotinate-nucleotide adenylyltransferase [Lachnospiraceae bacterium]
MQHIGILGGTFNPIHIGHLIIAEQAYSQFNLDKVLVMPSGVSYFKDGQGVLPAEVRLEMTRCAVNDNDHLEVSDVEVKRPGNTYTSDTLLQLHSLYIDAQLYFIIGADTLYDLETWHEPAIIFSNCVILVSVRDDHGMSDLLSKIDYYKIKYKADIRILNTTNIDISSTMIRDNVKRGISIKYYVPNSVIDYIKNNNLYR